MSENLPDIKRDSFFVRIRKFFNKSNKEEKETYIKPARTVNKKINFFEEEREKSKRYNYLLELQNKFENGEITESEISPNDIEELKKIYIEQIGTLKVKISKAKYQLQ